MRGEITEAFRLETVTGPIGLDAFTRALAHEHLFADFLGPHHPDDCRVDWEEVRKACVEGLGEVRGEGVHLLVECTGIGIGRNVDLLSVVSVETSVSIVCATGIYKACAPRTSPMPLPRNWRRCSPMSSPSASKTPECGRGSSNWRHQPPAPPRRKRPSTERARWWR